MFEEYVSIDWSWFDDKLNVKLKCWETSIDNYPIKFHFGFVFFFLLSFRLCGSNFTEKMVFVGFDEKVWRKNSFFLFHLNENKRHQFFYDHQLMTMIQYISTYSSTIVYTLMYHSIVRNHYLITNLPNQTKWNEWKEMKRMKRNETTRQSLCV